ncbi:GerMN domain-containing protein [Dactylosporangium sp. CA-052675]|uniref:GerMN domain-containing protein n=1 Tax=Dactylosporangium sp. CA-052675 TaxID=3239927 RepID=UPI003D938A56
MKRPGRLPGLALLAMVALLGLGGCGVPTEDSPRPIEPSAVIGSYEGPMAVTSPGAVVERLFFTRDSQLVPVDRRVANVPAPQQHLDDLVAGPTAPERDAGVDSALGGTSYITGVQLHNGTAVVGLSVDNPIRNDETLAYGQIVCTLAARADIVAVQFTQDGRTLEVPRGDGALTSAPLTEDDYVSLIAER